MVLLLLLRSYIRWLEWLLCVLPYPASLEQTFFSNINLIGAKRFTYYYAVGAGHRLTKLPSFPFSDIVEQLDLMRECLEQTKDEVIHSQKTIHQLKHALQNEQALANEKKDASGKNVSLRSHQCLCLYFSHQDQFSWIKPVGLSIYVQVSSIL